MGRKRTIDRDATMAAIESVVHKHGVGGLSIDAVAKEAGISKSSVVYDFKNKAGLLTAFTRSRMDSHRTTIESLREKLNGTDRWLRAALSNAIDGPTKEESAAAMMLCAAASNTEDCLSVLQQELDYVLGQVRADAGDERMARLAFLALHGLKTMEHFNFRRFSSQERREILDDIASLLDRQPAESQPSDRIPSTDGPKII